MLKIKQNQRFGCAGLGLAIAMGLLPAVAQSQQAQPPAPQAQPAPQATRASFAPAKLVNGEVITVYELSQRLAFLQLLGFPGDLRAEAMRGLIDDRLRLSAARALNLSVSAEALRAGMEEFAARGNLTADEFLKAIEEEGIAPETFRDFVSAGLVWRDVISERYSDRVTISEAAIDRALNNLNVPEAQTVTYSEIVLDAAGARRNQALALARDLEIDFIKGRAFSDAARAVSIGPTARNGGLLPAKKLSELDETVAVAVRALANGQLSKPMLIGDKIYLFQGQEAAVTPVPNTGARVVDLAEINLPSGRDAAVQLAQLRANIDSCVDLNDYAKTQTGMTVTRATAPARDVAGLVQTLDAGEIGGPVARGAAAIAVMVCARGLPPEQTATRDEVRIILKNQKLAKLADVYLSELRADALIRDP